MAPSPKSPPRPPRLSTLTLGWVLVVCAWLSAMLGSSTGHGDDQAPTKKKVRPASRATTPRIEFPAPPQQLIESLLVLHNEARMRKGLSELQVHPRLTACAQRYAEFALRNQKLSHDGDGRTPKERIAAEGLKIRSWAENMAWGHATPEATMATWLRSQVHHHNILGQHTHVGFGRAGNLWVTVFATPVESGLTNAR